MRKHSTLWQSMLIPMICLLMCVAINIASATTVLLLMTLLNQAKQTQPPSEQTLIGNISAEFYSKSGHAQAELMDYHEAVSDWTAVISHKPDYAVAYKLSRTCET